jgi:hypothetical protein
MVYNCGDIFHASLFHWGDSMKCFWIALSVAGVLLTGVSGPAPGQELATSHANASSQIYGAETPALDGSTTLVVELTRGVNSKKAKAGDEVKARVIQDVMAKGLIVVPRDSRLVGHVTEAKARSKDDPESRLGIVFDKALLKSGKQIGMSALVQALAPSLGRTATIDDSDPMIALANERSAKMLPRLDSGVNRSPTDTSARSIPPKIKLSNDDNIAQHDSPAPWTPGSALGTGYHGVFGFQDLALTSSPKGKGSVVTSIKSDVKLENGTQLVLKVVNVDH